MIIINLKFGIVILFLTILLGGCQTRPQSLGSTDIDSYEGQKLTSAYSLPENSIKGPSSVNLAAYHLQITGLVNSPLSYSYDEVLQKTPYTKLVILHCIEGWDATILWQGTKISDLIDAAQVKANSNTVIFHCQDGYTTSLPLDYIREKNILLAYKENGQVLPKKLGYPFIVIAEDKYGYKWARWVTEIELSDNAQYKGYWEQRGYSNNADVPVK
ncbi:MAG: molybdopterin-dependent oxidoreductase [Syntrophomonas sp.]